MTSPDSSPPLTLAALRARLTAASTTASRFTNLLSAHKHKLLHAITHPPPARTADPTAVVYLHPDAAATAYPHPTAQEEAVIQSLQSHLSLSRDAAANLVRDYLRHRVADFPLDQFLAAAPSDLAALAPLHAVKTFWLSERRAAFATVATILKAAAPHSAHPLRESASNFFAQNLQQLRSLIVDAADAVLNAFDDTATTKQAAVAAHHVHPWWCMELLFAFTLAAPLSLAERDKLCHSYCRLSKANHRFATPAAPNIALRVTPPTLDGGPTSLFFIAAMNRSNGLHDLLRTAHASAIDDDTDSGATNELDPRDVETLDNVHVAMRSDPSPETALLALSWGTYVRLRLPDTADDPTAAQQNLQASEHMEFAMSSNVLGALHDFATMALPVETHLGPQVAHTMWTDLSAFLVAFPPNAFVPSQVEDLVALATAVLKGMRRVDIAAVAKQLWQTEGSDRQYVGANSLLRIAAGVFPQTFRPLVHLITVLVVNGESAERVVDFLTKRLHTVTELPDGFRDSVLALDEDDGDVWEYVKSQQRVDCHQVYEVFQMVRPSHEDLVFVQSMEDMPEGGYRPSLPKGSIGVANHGLSVVTWITPWNGFGAVSRILHLLHEVLLDQQQAQRYDDAILDELTSSAAHSLKLIDRVCSEGSSDFVDNLVNTLDLSSTLTSIVIELADPGDRAKASWLTKVRQETLLTAASVALASVTAGSASRAQFALERIEASRNSYPFSRALHNLGDGAFPAVGALGRIASSCSRGAFLSQDKKFILSSLSGMSNRRNSDGLEGRETSTSAIVGFFRDTALPLWLTSTARNAADQNQSSSSYWLLPACSLELFSWNPTTVLYSPVVSSLFASVVTAICDSGVGKDSGSIDPFLFPALRSALAACFVALRERNKSLQERLRSRNSEKRLSTGSQGLDGISEPTPFEVTLQKPAVVHAMASLSSGSAPVFNSDEFFEAWSHSKYSIFLPKPDSSRLWHMYPQADEPQMESPSSWRSWVIAMSARCLSLQFCCLSHVSEQGDVIQVPWPTMHKPSFGNWRGGGDAVRMGFANRIRSGDPVPLLELLVSILACGQRAASRSLMAPRPSSPLSVDQSKNSPDNNKSEGAQNGDGSKSKCEIMTSVVGCLHDNLQEWLVKVEDLSNEDTEANDAIVSIGSMSLSIAGCIRFLRVAWESHSSKWFLSCWKELGVWSLFADILRCEGASLKNTGPTHFEKALKCENADAFVSKFNENDDMTSNSLSELVSKIPLSVDVPTVWKGAAADVLQVFTSQIIQKTTEGLLAMQAKDPESTTEETKDKLPLAIFQDESFTAFQSAFSEKWLRILFSPGESDCYDKGLSVSTPPGLEGDPMMKNISDSDEPQLVSAEEQTRQLSSSLAKLFNTGSENVGAEILQRFQRTGDVNMKFGADYYFDVPRLASFLELLSLEKQYIAQLLQDVIQLNLVLTRQDVQVGVVRAFSSITSAANFTDSLCLSASSNLTYSSAQFGGKVCRFLCHVLVYIGPTVATSRHSLAIAMEISKLIASLSSQLSPDELEQPALTAVKAHTIPLPKDVRSLSPVGQICLFIDDTLRSIERVARREGTDADRFEVVRWLLLTASKLSHGSAFASSSDLVTLSSTAMATLRMAKHVPLVVSAATVSLSTLLQCKRVSLSGAFDLKGMHTLFSAVAALADVRGDEASTEQAAEIASVLVLVVAHGYTSRAGPDNDIQSFILRQLSGGSVHGFLPPAVAVVAAYDLNKERRKMRHLFWCSCLQLASVVIPPRLDERGSLSENERERRDILQFCCANLQRLGRDSLDLTGDWASGHVNNPCGLGQLLTIGRVEEAELAAAVMFPLAGRALYVRGNIPDVLHSSIARLVQYVESATRLIRAEPVERWVRPISRRERGRSLWVHSDGSSLVNQTMGSTPLWGMSPVKASAPRSPTPPRRSPSQAVRAAVGDGRSSPVPTSPGFTPLQAPSNPGASASILSPLSPWGPHGAGIITESALTFGEEVSRSLLRGLASALGALRRFSIELDEPLFSTSTSSAEEAPGLGLLQSILHHAGGELQRGAEGERRDQFLSIAENALLLIVRHMRIYFELGALTQGAQDEIRKRASLYVQRMRRIVPPPPPTSIVHSTELDNFWKQLK